jgi:hypothetical protein
MLALLVPLAVGCGKGKGTVSGTVTLDGQPLPAGNITFIPSKGQGAGGTIQDGKYSVADVPAGKVAVTVETETLKKQMDALAQVPRQMNPGSGSTRLSPEMLAKLPENARAKMEESQKKSAEAPQKLKELQAKYRAIPDKYSKAESSGLTVEVKAGPNTFEVPLSSK